MLSTIFLYDLLWNDWTNCWLSDYYNADRLGWTYRRCWASQLVLVIMKLLANAGDIKDGGSTPGSGKSPGGRHTNHSSTLAWRIPWTEEPGGLWPIGSWGVGHDWSDVATAAAYEMLYLTMLSFFCISVWVYQELKQEWINHDRSLLFFFYNPRQL